MALTYNQPRFSQNLLAKFKKYPPSFTINLYDDHWTLNKGPGKFLYTQPVSGLLEEVRALRIPVDFIEIFDMAHVPYYDGCMIVESIDYRKPRALHPQAAIKEPESVRVVLQPSAESLYADLCLLNAKSGNKWTDQEALEIESKILTAISPPLCLEPDVNLTRIVNSVIRASAPSESVPLKRKQVHEPEEDENDKAKRAKLWSHYMHPRNGKPQTHSKRSIFDILHEVALKDDKGKYTPKFKHTKPEPTGLHSQGQTGQTLTPPNAPSTLSGTSSVSQSTLDDQKAKAKIKNGKKPELQEAQLQLTKGKKKPSSAPGVTAQAPSPAPEQRKLVTTVPGISRTPVDSGAMIANTPSMAPQYPHAQQPQQPPKGVLKKAEEQVAPQQAHPPQGHQANSMEQSHPPAAWQPTIPPAQYVSQTGKKKPVPPQPQQTSTFHPHTPAPGFLSNSGFPQNQNYKSAAGIPQTTPVTQTRGSPMPHNQPLLRRSPLPPHTQSPHPQVQQPQQASQAAAQAAAQHQLPQHPSHQFNVHMQPTRFNPTMQSQMSHHPHAVVPPQHGVPQQHQQQHIVQHPNAPRAGQISQHDQSQAMLHMQHYNAMQQFPYPQMHVQGMMNGMRMPGAGGQFMPTPGWRVPPGGRGAGPIATIPIGMAHAQTFQHPQMMAALARGQPQQQQPQGQGR